MVYADSVEKLCLTIKMLTQISQISHLDAYFRCIHFISRKTCLLVSNLINVLLFQFDYEDTSSVIVFGGSAVVALWLAAAVVGAIDSIPVVSAISFVHQ